MNAPNWLLRGVIFGFIIGVTLTLLCGVVWAEDELQVCKEGQADKGCRMYMWGQPFPFDADEKYLLRCHKKMVEVLRKVNAAIDDAARNHFLQSYNATYHGGTVIVQFYGFEQEIASVMKECIP